MNESLMTYPTSYDERISENRVSTSMLEGLDDETKRKIKAHLRIHHNYNIHLSTSDDPFGTNHLAKDSQAVMIIAGVDAANKSNLEKEAEYQAELKDINKGHGKKAAG